MKRMKLSRLFLMGIIILIGVFIFVSCTPTAPVKKPEGVSPVVLVAPSKVFSQKEGFSILGTNFEPGAEVKVVMQTFPGVESVMGAQAAGLALEINDSGCFWLESSVPSVRTDVYAIVVYNRNGEMIATTPIAVE